MKCNIRDNDNIFLKIRFYIISLWLLFILIFLLTVDIPISFVSDAKFIGFNSLIKRNVLAVVAAILAFISWCLTCKTKYEWSGVNNPPYTIENIKNENYEYLTFLTTYIIPLICIDLNSVRYIIILGVLLILIGLIFVKMDLYYGNPTLALMGYRLYRVKIKGVDSSDGIILISRDRLYVDAEIKWMKVDEFVWVVKELKK